VEGEDRRREMKAVREGEENVGGKQWPEGRASNPAAHKPLPSFNAIGRASRSPERSMEVWRPSKALCR
jgi:hypothetical protein